MKLARVWLLGAMLSVACVSAHAEGPHGRPGWGSPIDLVMIPEVQRELRLDDGQTDAVRQLGQGLRAKMQEIFQSTGGFQNLSQEERHRRFQAMGEQRARAEKQLAEILDNKQSARLRQIGLQREGYRALTRPDVAAELRLTPDQRQRIQAALDGERQAFKDAFQGFGAGMSPDRREEIRRKAGEILQSTDARLLGTLTDAQKRQFQAMQGAPFKFPERHFRPRPPGG
ncbi:MAG TPA: hypothetical protein VFU47_16430 [Armatimonadota bacterium]|nr:hypothetical protein [Armatimonadota bacterium]